MARNDKERSDRLHDFLIEEIIAGDEHDLEIDKENVNLFNSAVAAGHLRLARRRLDSAKIAARLDQQRLPVTGIEKARARARLQVLKTGANDDGTNLTLAARFGTGDIDDDIDGLLEDIAELERSRNDD